MLPTSSNLRKDEKNLADGHKPIPVDMRNAGRSVWIVKVPNYVHEAWQRAPSDMTVAKMSIEQLANGGKGKLNLTLTDECVGQFEKPLPKHHQLHLKEMTGQNIGIMSQNFKSNNTIESKAAFEGAVARKLECRPRDDSSYINMKIDAFKKAEVPNRIAKPLEKIVQTYKPVKEHLHNIETREQRKSEGRRFRYDKEKVIDMLIEAFAKQEYFTLKELVNITNQPVGYLKGILSEIADFTMRLPFKHMWHLKPEYTTGLKCGRPKTGAAI